MSEKTMYLSCHPSFICQYKDFKYILYIFFCNDIVDLCFNKHISILEVKKAVESAELGKASGIDDIPVEVLKK